MFDIKYNVQRRPLDRIDLNNKIDEQLQVIKL